MLTGGAVGAEPGGGAGEDGGWAWWGSGARGHRAGLDGR